MLGTVFPILSCGIRSLMVPFNFKVVEYQKNYFGNPPKIDSSTRYSIVVENIKKLFKCM